MSGQDLVGGVRVDLQQLTRLRYQVQGLSFLPSQPVHSLLSGRHASRVRGRGLDFEELRGYLPGDDPRTIDWKVTARTGEPHVRVYTEERDRPALVVVDQRIEMFFGTRLHMKSYVAAILAAAVAWRVTESGDRIGGIVFDDSSAVQVSPDRSLGTVMRILHALVDKNSALSAASEARANRGMLNEALRTAARTAKHDYLVVILSDFAGEDEETRRLVSRMAQHNDVLAIPIFDPSSQELPAGGQLVVSDGELQIELSLERGAKREQAGDFMTGRLSSVLAWGQEIGVPVGPISAGESIMDQVRRLLGRRAAMG